MISPIKFLLNSQSYGLRKMLATTQHRQFAGYIATTSGLKMPKFTPDQSRNRENIEIIAAHRNAPKWNLWMGEKVSSQLWWLSPPWTHRCISTSVHELCACVANQFKLKSHLSLTGEQLLSANVYRAIRAISCRHVKLWGECRRIFLSDCSWWNTGTLYSDTLFASSSVPLTVKFTICAGSLTLL